MFVSGLGFISLQGPTLTIASPTAGVGGTSRGMDLFFGMTGSVVTRSDWVEENV
jgi:hypothetical protein